MTYAPQHASASRLVGRKGGAVSFTTTTRTHGGSTGTSTATTATMTGYAVRVRGDARQYERLNLVESESPTLLFVPDTYGDIPELGAKVTWGGSDYTVRAVEATAPDGTAVLSRVVVSR